jgi:hypothetical protein
VASGKAKLRAKRDSLGYRCAYADAQIYQGTGETATALVVLELTSAEADKCVFVSVQCFEILSFMKSIEFDRLLAVGRNTSGVLGEEAACAFIALKSRGCANPLFSTPAAEQSARLLKPAIFLTGCLPLILTGMRCSGADLAHTCGRDDIE